MQFTSLLTVPILLRLAVAAPQATTTTPPSTTTSPCPCASSAAPDPTATASGLTCNFQGSGTGGTFIPLNTGGRYAPPIVDFISTCANLCYTEYGQFCKTFAINNQPDGYGCLLYAYTTTDIALEASDSGLFWYDRECFDQTCPYNPTGTSTCPPSPTVTSGGTTTCTCAAGATIIPYHQAGTQCALVGTAAPTATPYATAVSPYDTTDGFDTASNYYAGIRYCGKTCLKDSSCTSFEITNADSTAQNHTCLLYSESVDDTGFVQDTANTGNGAYDRGCFQFNCDTGVSGC